MAEKTDKFNSKSFYGNKCRKRRYEIKSLIEKQVKKQRKYSLPEQYKTRIGGPSSSWKIFYKQNEAFRFAHSTSEDLHVFSYEKEVVGEVKGQRLYLVTSYDVFWHYYRQLTCDKRHHYEIIPEASVCKLYFDLEYVKEFNQQSDGSTMVQNFIKYVCYWLNKIFNLSCGSSQVLNLDASTEYKFSRHLIFQLPNAAFQDNIQAGYFVHHIMNKLDDIVTYGERFSDSGVDLSSEELSVNSLNTNTYMEIEHNEKSNDETVSNIDNENKMAESIDKTQQNEIDQLKEYNDILDILSISDLQAFFIYDKYGERTTFVDTGVYTKNRNFRFYLSTKLGKSNPLITAKDNQFKSNGDESIFFASLISNVTYNEQVKILNFNGGNVSEKCSSIAGNIKNISETMEGDGRSPYPEIERFITNLINDGTNNKTGQIRHWTYFTAGELLIYDIAKYRWCHNIKRQHKSNNIMYIVDIRRGVYYQKCHDPECKKQCFKSPDYEIPCEYLPHYLLDQDDLMMTDDDDDELLLQAMDHIENSSGDSQNLEQLSSAECDNVLSDHTKSESNIKDDISDEELLSLTKEVEEQHASL